MIPLLLDYHLCQSILIVNKIKDGKKSEFVNFLSLETSLSSLTLHPVVSLSMSS